MVEHMASIVGEASSSSSASTPTSSRSCSWTYHVFLSFRGEDTREGFLGHLYAALERKGITIFKDDRVLQKGDVISDELLRAIDESMFAITVLSPNYATSTWCLDELQRIVERSKDRGLVIFPIFYDVEPSDVRHQNNSFKEAFDNHEGRFGQDSEKIKKWRYALTTVAGCLGWNSKNEEEAAVVESIAQGIHKKLIPKLPSSIENLVGIHSKVDGVSSFLGMGLNDVRSIGIWGVGGVGKTTIARTVYEAIQGDFKVSCFLDDVREKEIVQIQQELVAHVNICADTFKNKYDGRSIIRNSLCNKKVLLVIDNINEASQLENLAGGQDWFGPGSRIIITTRNLHLLNIHGVYGSYEVEGLNENEALRLFCLKAFKQDQPKEGYLNLSKQVIKYGGGLPLALRTLGSFLCGRTIDVWNSAIRKISDQCSGILDTLKISYEDLDSTGKNVFLDIACFFKGMAKDYVIGILQNCGHNPKIEIDVLTERSLITLSKEGKLEMHDLIEQMGKNIVSQEFPNDRCKRSRLWSEEDIDYILTKNEGTNEIIQGIVCQELYKGCCSIEAFSNMSQLKQLKLLKICGMKLPPGLNHLPLPSSLKVLHWKLYPLKTLPLADVQYEIVDFVLNSHKIQQLWHGKKILEKLKNLELNNCSKLNQMPDLSGLPNLEKLRLLACPSLTKVHPSLIHHKNLVVLDLSECWGLETFPGKLEMSCLKELILDGCNGLKDLPEFGECMKNLSRLSLKKTTIRQLPPSHGCLVGLEELILSDCKDLICLPDSHELKSLRILDASRCRNLNTLPSSVSHLPFLSSLDLSICRLTEIKFPPPVDFCHFPALTELNLSGSHFFTIPIPFHKFPKLRNLMLKNCQSLESLPELPSSIRELDARDCVSLNTSKFNPLSKACSFFTSPAQDHGQVLQMLITGKDIPSWFVHQEDGNCVSIPYQHDFLQNERLGIALCFQIHSLDYSYKSSWCLDVRNGKRLVTKMITDMKRGDNLYILYLSNDYFSNEIQSGNQLELLTSCPKDELKILRSAAGWMHKQDIEDLKKSEMEFE